MVLNAVDGTELFNFIVLNETYTEKARALMAAFREQPGNSKQEVFDMGKLWSKYTGDLMSLRLFSYQI
ncbi:hypothetical protein [Dysgonomonas sp.]